MASWIPNISIAWDGSIFRSTAAARRGLFRLNGLLARATNAARACDGGGLGGSRGLWPDSNPLGVICPRCPARSFQTQVQDTTNARLRSVRRDTTRVALGLCTSAPSATLGAMIQTLETPRLWLRPLVLANAAEVQQLFPQWEVVK